MTVSIRPGRYIAAVMETEPGGERLQTGWFRTHPPSDMLEWAIRHNAEGYPRLRVLYLVRATVPKPVDIPRAERAIGESQAQLAQGCAMVPPDESQQTLKK